MTTDPTPSSPVPAPPGSEPSFALLVMCVECGDGAELPLPIDGRLLAFHLAQRGWFVTVVSPPGQGIETPYVLGPLCAACAPKVYSPEVLAAAEERRQQLLRAAQEAR